jgi:chemotaxis protein CheX
MKVQQVNPFVTAACDVLSGETGQPVTRGSIGLEGDPYTTEEVTALIGISGSIRGSMYLSMSLDTAVDIVSTMLGQPVPSFDALAQSGIAELANVVAGTAGTAMSNDGNEIDITPPLMMIGAGARISALDLQRVAVPIETSCGQITVHLAFRGD